MFQHQYAAGRGQGQSPAGAALADNQRDKRHAQLQAFIGAARNRFRLAALFRANARISARRIHQGHHRQVKTLGHIHDANGLSVPLGPRHAEIML